MAWLKKPSEPAGLGSDHEPLRQAARRIGHAFADLELLREALTHASIPRAVRPCASERLEFLGDAVLNLTISEALFERHGEWTEGRLSQSRSSLVRTASLAGKAKAIGLDAALRLGRGEERSGGRCKASILAAVYESVLGAVFIDGGYGAVRRLVSEHFEAELSIPSPAATDFKTRLQEQTQACFGEIPKYRVTRTEGPDHARRFLVVVEIGGKAVAEGSGSSKREAEQQAAARALQLGFDDSGPGDG